MKFMFTNGRVLEINDEGFTLFENGEEVLTANDFDTEFGYIQLGNTTKFEIFKDKEITTYKLKED